MKVDENHTTNPELIIYALLNWISAGKEVAPRRARAQSRRPPLSSFIRFLRIDGSRVLATCQIVSLVSEAKQRSNSMKYVPSNDDVCRIFGLR